MILEKKVLINILKYENRDKNFEKMALEALKINNVFDLKRFVEKYNLNVDIDISDDLSVNKEKVYYQLNEEFYKLRDSLN
ncbi:hypothetical protein [Nautilia sp.]